MKIKNIHVYVLRVPVDRPIRSAVIQYDNRPAVLVRIQDEDGIIGWGEIFCNIPPCGAEHRARLIDTLFKQMLLGKEILNPPEIYNFLTRETEILMVKSGEFGPFSQCISGIDIALWDLYAKSQKVPLWRLLNPNGSPDIAVYASGIGPEDVEQTAIKKLNEGFRAFKLKVGFDRALDLQNLGTLRKTVGSNSFVMVDANQVWSFSQAVEASLSFFEYDLLWIEEPIRVTQPFSEWKELSVVSPIKLAAGENFRGESQFMDAIKSQAIKYLQPDVIKWGGISGLLPILKTCSSTNIQYCPHCYGGGVGLIASANLLASFNGKGLLEIDSQPNPLQTSLIQPFPTVIEGKIHLSESPGLGWEPKIDSFQKHLVYQTY